LSYDGRIIAAFSSSPDFAISDKRYGNAYVFDTHTWSNFLKIHRKDLAWCSFTRNGHLIVISPTTISDFGDNGRRPSRVSTVGLGDDVQAATASDDGRWLAVGLFDKVVIWDIRNRSKLRAISSPWKSEGHSACVHTLDFSAGGRYLFASDNNVSPIIEVSTGRVLGYPTDGIGIQAEMAKFSDDGTQLLTASSEMQLWGLNNLRQPKRTLLDAVETAGLVDIDWNQRAKLIAVSDFGIINIYQYKRSDLR
jgi:hypothetical protein